MILIRKYISRIGSMYQSDLIENCSNNSTHLYLLTCFHQLLIIISAKHDSNRVMYVHNNCINKHLTELYSMEIWILFIETDNVTAPPDGSGVQDVPTTGVSQSGCSVMEKMTVVMGVMSYRRTVLSAMKLETSTAQTTDAFPSKYLSQLQLFRNMHPCEVCECRGWGCYSA